MKEDKRKNPLTIISHRGVKTKLNTLMKLAYKTSVNSMGFKIYFKEVRHGMNLKVNELNFSFGRTMHTIPNLAVRIEDNKKDGESKSIIYSGDGSIVKTSEKFFDNCDLLIQESFYINKTEYGQYHSGLKNINELVNKNIKKIALVHISRKENDKIKQYLDKQKEKNSNFKKVFVAKEKQVIEF